MSSTPNKNHLGQYITKKKLTRFIWMRLIHGRKDRNSFSPPHCKQYHLHLYAWLHTHIYGCITYRTSWQQSSSSIMAQDLDGAFWLIHTIFRVLLFQYNLNSRSSICNSGQTSTSRLFREKNLGESFCLFINKVATGFNLLPSSWQMEQTSWPNRN